MTSRPGEQSASLTFAGSLTAKVNSPTPLASVLARRIKATRGALGLTQRDLAARLEVAGVKIDQSRIARIEREEASLDLSEGIAVALALEVPLVALLSPSEPFEKVALTPTITVDRDQLQPWLHGWHRIARLLAELHLAAKALEELAPAYERAKSVMAVAAKRVTPDNVTVVRAHHSGTTWANEAHGTMMAYAQAIIGAQGLRTEAVTLLENPLLPTSARAVLQEHVNALQLPPEPLPKVPPLVVDGLFQHDAKG